MFNLQEYRVIAQGLLVTIAELEDASQKIDNILAGQISPYNHLELAAYRDDFKDSVERLSTALVEFKKRAVSDKVELVRGVNAVRREYRLRPRQSKQDGVTFHKSPEPIYCSQCGLLADTFCECGFLSPEHGAA